MLVRAEGDARVVIGQASHAWLSGQLARAWGNREFPAPWPREEVCLAAEQHDVGMSMWDLAPRLHHDGRGPVSFMEMTVSEHLALWRAAPDRLMSASHHAALLVSMHGSALYSRRDAGRMSRQDAAAVRDYLATERERQADLAARLGADPVQLEVNRRLVWTWDGLSLALCLGWTDHVALEVPAADGRTADLRLRWRGENSGQAACLDPWPFTSEEIEVSCEARRIEQRFADAAELAEGCVSARPFNLSFLLRPGAGPRQPPEGAER